MAFKLKSDIRETSTSGGTGNQVLAGALDGSYKAFASEYSDGDTFFYCMKLGSAREIGKGIYNASSNSITRAQVYKSTNSNGLVSFPAGTVDIFVTNIAPDDLDAAGRQLLLSSLLSDTTEATGAGTTAAAIFSGGVEFLKKIFVTGVARFKAAVASTSTTTGSVVVDGGVGVGGAVNVGGNIAAGGSVASAVAASSAWQFDASGVPVINLASGGAVALPPGGGLVFVKNESNGVAALFMITGGQVILIAQIGAEFAAGSSAGGKSAIVWTGTFYALANGTAGASNYRCMMLRGSPSN